MSNVLYFLSIPVSFALSTLSSAKLQRTNPVLVASVIGSIRKLKVRSEEDLKRKGFGGPNRAEDIDLTPAVVQSVSRILKNCHPYSLTLLSSMNSIFLWSCKVSGKVFEFFNLLGDCYR